MDPKKIAREARKQTHLERLGTTTPRCGICGETDWRCLEAHHIAGRHYDPTTAVICRNCHRRLSDDQRDHPKPIDNTPSPQEIWAHMLFGIADFLVLAAETIRGVAEALIAMVRSAAAQRQTAPR